MPPVSRNKRKVQSNAHRRYPEIVLPDLRVKTLLLCLDAKPRVMRYGWTGIVDFESYAQESLDARLVVACLGRSVPKLAEHDPR